MYVMPKRIDPKVKERCVQRMLDHVAEYPSETAAAEVVAKRNGVGAETVRRLYLQIQELKARVRRLEEDNDILRRASISFAGELDPRRR
jgi:transposase